MPEINKRNEGFDSKCNVHLYAQIVFVSHILTCHEFFKAIVMRAAYKRKSRVEALEVKYQRLLTEIHHLTESNSEVREKKTSEAQRTLKEIDVLTKKRLLQ